MDFGLVIGEHVSSSHAAGHRDIFQVVAISFIRRTTVLLIPATGKVISEVRHLLDAEQKAASSVHKRK